ncbi:MAG: insulinase family protein [Opitutae bacterium]|nr:insulinase family protein [Opitutae bacterium]
MLSRIALLSCLVVASLFAAPITTQLPQETSDLPVDPAVKWGRLDNGIRYAVLPNHEPKNRASLRFVVRAGSLNETDDQRGLAHFLEHMAFNGSTHYAPGTLVEFFQRLGMSFGGDTNAFTSFDRTVYMLELPDVKPDTVEKAVTLFADYAGGLLLLEDEINKERGIILSEKRARDSVEFRQFIGEFEFLLPDARFIQRIPIGLEEVIAKAPRARFVDFYNTWYRPELISVVAVGDFDPAAIEAVLKEKLSPVAARALPAPQPSLGHITPVEGVVAKLLPEREAGAVQVSIQTVTPYNYEPDTAANRLKYLPRQLALRMLNRRLSVLAKQEGAPFIGGQVGATEQFDFFRNASVELSCKPEQWRAALAVGEQELRRALQFGFQPAELKEAVAGLRNALEQAVRTAPTRRSDGLAMALVDSFVDQNVFTHPKTELDLFAPALDKITVDACLAALRETWNEKTGRRLWVTGNLTLEQPEQQIVGAYEASRAVAVQPPAKIEEAQFAYTNFGAPGAVQHEQKVDDLGTTLIDFANGVRLNLKPTDFEAGRVRLSVRVGGGRLTEPADQPGLGFFTGNTFLSGGLGQHSADDLQRLLAGKTVGTNFTITGDAFVFQGGTNRTDLALQLQLLAAYVTDPGFRPEAMRLYAKGVEAYYARGANTVEWPLQTEVPRLLANGDARFGIPPKEAATARTLAEAKAWLAPQFARGPIEIAIVGDFDAKDATAAVARTFGALPPREAKPAYDAERHVDFGAPVAKQFFTVTEIPKGVVQLFWPATDGRDAKISRRLSMLAEVLNDRLRVKIREEMGDTYSPDAGASLSDTYKGYGHIVASATVAPEKARAVADAMKAAAASLFEKGVTEEELVRAKQPILTSARQSVRTNPYWLGSVLAAAQEQPERLEWARNRLGDLESITTAELTEFAHRYLDPAKASEFISLPEAKKAN